MQRLKCNTALAGLMALILAMVPLAGCATTPPDPDPEPYDPIEPVNRRIYAFNDQLDRYVAKPLADAYVAVTPRFVRTGVTNFFRNARYPGTILNGALQGEWGQSGRDTGRFLVNSTVGVLGLFDVATPMGLERNSADFGETLGKWGTPEGMYLVLPALGPSNSRDVNDIPVSTATNLVTYVGGWIVFPLYALEAIDTRARLDQAARLRSEAALDEYSFTRSAYRQYRNHIIFDGDVPERDPFDDLDDW